MKQAMEKSVRISRHRMTRRNVPPNLDSVANTHVILASPTFPMYFDVNRTRILLLPRLGRGPDE